MSNYDPELVALARKIQRDLPNNNPRTFRTAFENTLRVMIRCAIRTGLGRPCLVNWVDRQLAAGQTDRAVPRDPLGAAAPLARTLCEGMMESLGPLPWHETVVGL